MCQPNLVHMFSASATCTTFCKHLSFFQNSLCQEFLFVFQVDCQGINMEMGLQRIPLTLHFLFQAAASTLLCRMLIDIEARIFWQSPDQSFA